MIQERLGLVLKLSNSVLRDGRDHFNKGATLLPGKIHILEDATKLTNKGVPTSLTETFVRILISWTI